MLTVLFFFFNVGWDLQNFILQFLKMWITEWLKWMQVPQDSARKPFNSIPLWKEENSCRRMFRQAMGHVWIGMALLLQIIKFKKSQQKVGGEEAHIDLVCLKLWSRFGCSSTCCESQRSKEQFDLESHSWYLRQLLFGRIPSKPWHLREQGSYLMLFVYGEMFIFWQCLDAICWLVTFHCTQVFCGW